MPTWAMWAVGLGLLFFRGVMGAAEAALYSTSDLRAKELLPVHPRRARRLMQLKTEREATTASLRFSMVLSGFTAAAIAALMPPKVLDWSLSRLWDSALLTSLTPLLSALLVALLASVLDAIFRAAANAKPDAWALALSALVWANVRVLYPVMKLMVAPINLLLAPFDTKVSFQGPPPPLDELEKMLASKAARHEIDKGAPALIRSIFELSDKTCRDVMVPRTEVVAVEISITPQEILARVAEENHSRMPVYRQDVDHIVGILHVRDMVPLMQHPELILLQDLIRPAVFVPWVKPIGDLLREMQRQKIHMAAVVDEYGGFMGIVTLEDILREIVGDIGDEFEEEFKPFEKQSDGSYLVDAMLPGADFARVFEFKLPEGEYETLGGFLSSLAGAIPDVGEKFTLHGWTFVVHSKEGPKLDRIRVFKPKGPERRESKKDLEHLPRPSPARN